MLLEKFYGEPRSICSETYLVIGPFEKKNLLRIYCLILKQGSSDLCSFKKINTQQNLQKRSFQFVPLQPWTDEELYKKYNLTDDEIAFIESMIRPME